MRNAYVVMKRGKWLTGDSYGSGVGRKFHWSSNPFEAWIVSSPDRIHVPPGARVVAVRVSPSIEAALRYEDGDDA